MNRIFAGAQSPGVLVVSHACSKETATAGGGINGTMHVVSTTHSTRPAWGLA